MPYMMNVDMSVSERYRAEYPLDPVEYSFLAEEYADDFAGVKAMVPALRAVLTSDERSVRGVSMPSGPASEAKLFALVHRIA